MIGYDPVKDMWNLLTREKKNLNDTRKVKCLSGPYFMQLV